MPGFPVLHSLPEFAQTHWISGNKRTDENIALGSGEIWEGDASLDLKVSLKNDGGGVGNEITPENPGRVVQHGKIREDAEGEEVPTKSLGWTDQTGGRETGKTNWGSPGREQCQEKRVGCQKTPHKRQEGSGPTQHLHPAILRAGSTTLWRVRSD